MDTLNSSLKSVSSFLDKNPTIVLIISLITTLYATLAAPRLPNSVIEFFDSSIGKLIFLFLIAFVASKNIQIALAVAVGFFLILHVANMRKVEAFRMQEMFRQYEHFVSEPIKSEVANTKVADVAKTYNEMIYADHDHSMDVHCKMESESKSAICKWFNGLKETTTKTTESVSQAPEAAGQGTTTKESSTAAPMETVEETPVMSDMASDMAETKEGFIGCRSPIVSAHDSSDYAPASF